MPTAQLQFGEDFWAGVVLVVAGGVLLCALLVRLVRRIEQSEGLEDDLDRE